jgi:hypothetical protein
MVGRRSQHLDALVEGRARIVFMGKHPWQNEYNFIDLGERGARKCDVGYRNGVETSRENSDVPGRCRRSLEKVHA